MDVIYEIASEIEYDFENIMGERIMYYENIWGDSVKYLDHMNVYENYIDLPAQIRNEFIINDQSQEIRAIYNLGPSTDMELSFAKEWYDGIVDIMTIGNKEREWGLEKKYEVDVVGLPERTTFFLYEDDYSEFYIEIYYSNTLKRVDDSRLALIFVFPTW